MRTTQELFNLSGQTALVTGGSRGLGLQMALALGEQGAKVVLSSRKQAELDQAVAYLAERGVTAYAIAADLGKEASVGPLVDAALEKLGRAGRGLSAGSVGQGHEPEHPQHLPGVAGSGQAFDDST
jgi:gluconate 5-dehydrogenase